MGIIAFGLSAFIIVAPHVNSLVNFAKYGYHLVTRKELVIPERLKRKLHENQARMNMRGCTKAERKGLIKSSKNSLNEILKINGFERAENVTYTLMLKDGKWGLVIESR